MTHPLCLRAGTAPAGSDPVDVTPERAGWAYAGLAVVEVPAGGKRTIRTGPDEVAVLPLSGSAVVSCEGRRFELEGRPDVFSGPTDFAYAPIDSEVTIESPGGGRFALPSARATKRLEPAYGPASGVPVEIRGAGRSTRQVNNFLEPDAFPADKLVAVEVITPAGNWSSYPPHKHDENREGEAVLEEIYYFEISSPEGFAVQRLYTGDGEIDLCEPVGTGDVVLIPRGYHGPSMAAPGYDLYYLNVLAGPGEERTMAFCDDPAHHWVRGTWDSEDPDSRLPLGRR